VAAGKQADQDAVDDALLANDNLGYFVADLVKFGDRRARGGFNRHGLILVDQDIAWQQNVKKALHLVACRVLISLADGRGNERAIERFGDKPSDRYISGSGPQRQYPTAASDRSVLR
jgi:hypothetical protein